MFGGMRGGFGSLDVRIGETYEAAYNRMLHLPVRGARQEQTLAIDDRRVRHEFGRTRNLHLICLNNIMDANVAKMKLFHAMGTQCALLVVAEVPRVQSDADSGYSMDAFSVLYCADPYAVPKVNKPTPKSDETRLGGLAIFVRMTNPVSPLAVLELMHSLLVSNPTIREHVYQSPVVNEPQRPVFHAQGARSSRCRRRSRRARSTGCWHGDRLFERVLH